MLSNYVEKRNDIYVYIYIFRLKEYFDILYEQYQYVK